MLLYCYVNICTYIYIYIYMCQLGPSSPPAAQPRHARHCPGSCVYHMYRYYLVLVCFTLRVVYYYLCWFVYILSFACFVLWLHNIHIYIYIGRQREIISLNGVVLVVRLRLEPQRLPLVMILLMIMTTV